MSMALRYSLNFFLNLYSRWWSPIQSLGTVANNSPIVLAPGDDDDGEIGGMIGRGYRSTRKKKTCPNAALSTTNPTC
jgi:hypothetical protein